MMTLVSPFHADKLRWKSKWVQVWVIRCLLIEHISVIPCPLLAHFWLPAWILAPSPPKWSEAFPPGGKEKGQSSLCGCGSDLHPLRVETEKGMLILGVIRVLVGSRLAPCWGFRLLLWFFPLQKFPPGPLWHWKLTPSIQDHSMLSDLTQVLGMILSDQPKELISSQLPTCQDMTLSPLWA